LKHTSASFLKAHLALATVAIVYGVNYITLKPVFNEGFNSFEILGIRCLIATSVFVLYHTLTVREKITDRKDFLRLMACGFFGVSLNQTFFLWGISNTSPVHASVLMISTPVFVFVIAWFMKQESLNLQKVIGLGISFAAAAALVVYGSDEGDQANAPSVFGDILITVNALSYATYLVLVRPLIQKYSAFTITKWIFIFGSIPNIIIGAFFLEPDHFKVINTEAWIGLAVLILGATLVAYFLNAWALKTVPSSSVGVYIYLQPVLVTILTAIFGLGEVNLLKITYILLIFAGVFLVTTKTNFFNHQKAKV